MNQKGPCNSAFEVCVSPYAKDIAGSFWLERIIINRTDTNLFLYLRTDGMKGSASMEALPANRP